MTATINGITVTGTPEEISKLIKIHGSKVPNGTTTIPYGGGVLGGGIFTATANLNDAKVVLT